MSLSAQSSAGSESTIGLSTPHLNDGENTSMSTIPTTSSSNHISNEADSSINNNKVASVFDIAQDMQSKLDQVVQLLDKHDTEVNDRIEKLLTRITKLESSVHGK
ncbi:hypothetical protein DFJ63DRAFT_315077 [Scheffersomyces coipomensis]|uniref:uncharacterized protein n=1 Tax=Scheffersomyces coipomensis TaxID=1788519 RepID=UPI00315C88D6